MKTITDKEILDRIVEGLCGDTTWEGVAFVNIENLDKDIYITGSVKWEGGYVDHFIEFNGREYLDYSEWERTGFTDLELEAWIGQEKVDIDTAYIETALEATFN